MYVRIRVRTYAGLRTYENCSASLHDMMYVGLCVSGYMCSCGYAYTNVRMHAYVSARVRMKSCTHVYVYIYMYIYIYTCGHARVSKSISVYVCMSETRMCQSVSLSVTQSFCQSVCVCQSVSLSVCHVCLSACLSFSLVLALSLCLSLSLAALGKKLLCAGKPLRSDSIFASSPCSSSPR